ncbi:hypothetical protein EKH55_4206 [Sinorhizobium alkalisoli]|nr:hypothetical protein EKH55_4206 [Sinorhizobium alkalisoli]
MCPQAKADCGGSLKDRPGGRYTQSCRIIAYSCRFKRMSCGVERPPSGGPWKQGPRQAVRA